MPPASLSPQARALLDGRCFGHLATLMGDGSPKVEPVWVGREDDRVLVATDRRTLKGRNMDRDPRVALSVIDFHDPYRQLLIRGRVAEVRPDAELETLDALSQTYLGTPFPRRRWSDRVVYVIEPQLARFYQSPLVHPPDPNPGNRRNP